MLTTGNIKMVIQHFDFSNNNQVEMEITTQQLTSSDQNISIEMPPSDILFLISWKM
jgi:hypothetical protein